MVDALRLSTLHNLVYFFTEFTLITYCAALDSLKVVGIHYTRLLFCLDRAMCWCTIQHTFYADVFVDAGLVNALTITENLEILPLCFSRLR